MKFNKAAAGLTAAAVAASAMAATASASIKVVDGHYPDFTSGSGMWMVMLYKNDDVEAEVDYGLDLTSIATMKVQFTTDDTDFFEGMFGGAMVMSCGPASITPADHNWVQQNWWGVADDDAEIWTQDTESSPIQSTKIGDYTYEVTMKIDDSNCFYTNATYCQSAIMEWGSDMSQLVVLGMEFFDASGNSMIKFDGNGKANIPNLAGQAAEEEAPAEETTAAAEEAPVTTADDADNANEAAPAETTAAAAEEAPAATTVEEAPAATTAAAVVTTTAQTQAPAAGDVAAATSSTKGSPDTGVADVAAVAGLAIVAAGAILVSKKRK